MDVLQISELDSGPDLRFWQQGQILQVKLMSSERHGSMLISRTNKRDQGTRTMLVLSRKKDEKIVIGDNVSIMIVEIRGDKVRLGIEAPREISVHRREVYDAIKRKEAEGEGDEAPVTSEVTDV